MLDLKQSLEESGIDTAELDIDFTKSSISPKQAASLNEIHREMMVKQLKNSLGSEAVDTNDDSISASISVRRVRPSNIDYYDMRQRRPPEMFEQMEELQEEGIDIDDYRVLDRSYSKEEERGAYPLSSIITWEKGLEDLLEFARENISSKRKGKLELVEEVLENPGEIDSETVIRWFEDKDTLEFEHVNRSILESDREMELGKEEKILEQTVDEYWDEIKQHEISDVDMARRGLALDLVKTLQGLALNKDDRERYLEKLDSFESFFRNFQPEIYYELGLKNHNYQIRPVVTENRDKGVAVEVGSCLQKADYSEAHWMYADDDFTFVQAVGRNGKLKGYVRSFILEDSDGNNFLGIDTIEVPKTGGIELENVREDFEQNADILKAGALGAINLAQDLNLDYVAARDARVRFGLRQGYGNTQRSIDYRKPGETVPYYSVAPVEFSQEQNRIVSPFEEFEGETETKKFPGFGVYHRPEEQELRGFQTEPGWHQNSAYILFENPENF